MKRENSKRENIVKGSIVKDSMKRVFSLIICVIFIIGIMPTNFQVNAGSVEIPVADAVYGGFTTDPIVITEDKTVELNNVNIEIGASSDNGSPIHITNNANVNLIIKGVCILTGNMSIIGAGIRVDEGSSVTIYGEEGSSLTVTGGKYSAGIGGIGYKEAVMDNPKSGEITIVSGNIHAIGGDRGAGIGSGYHSSVSSINIRGGNVLAIGNGCGAGIGTGFGTTGGAYRDAQGNPTASGVGFYNGGDINITGGVVKAFSYNINPDDLDIYDTETFYKKSSGESYSTTTFGAGIGGGYGASAGNITISGTADVTAGGCGGGA